MSEPTRGGAAEAIEQERLHRIQPDEPLDAVTAKAADAPSAEELMAATDEGLRILWLYGRQDASRAARREIHHRKGEAWRRYDGPARDHDDSPGDL